MRYEIGLTSIATIALAVAVVACGSSSHPGRSISLGPTDWPPVPNLSPQPLPTPTPSPDLCGEWSNQSVAGTAGSSIAALYGELRNCGRFGKEWLIATLGKHDNDFNYTTSGVMAVYMCGDNPACLDGRNDHPIGGWLFVAPPTPSGVTVSGVGLDGSCLGVMARGAHCFNFVTNTFE
jgi:hypothetical protein